MSGVCGRGKLAIHDLCSYKVCTQSTGRLSSIYIYAPKVTGIPEGEQHSEALTEQEEEQFVQSLL